MGRGLYKRDPKLLRLRCDVCGERIPEGAIRVGQRFLICRRCYNPNPVYPKEPDTFEDFNAPPKRIARLRYYALRIWKAEDLCCMLNIRLERVRTDFLDRLLAECGLDSFERFCQQYCQRKP